MTTITHAMCVAASDAALKLGVTLPASQADEIIKAALGASLSVSTTALVSTTPVSRLYDEPVRQVIAGMKSALDETYHFASTSPGSQDNINLVLDKLDELQRLFEEVASESCLQKLRAGEPFFVLLGRDRNAAEAVRCWADRREADRGHSAKVDGARQIADAMDAFRGDDISTATPTALEVAVSRRRQRRAEYALRVAANMELCGKNIVTDTGLPTSTSEYLKEGAAVIRELAAGHGSAVPAASPLGKMLGDVTAVVARDIAGIIASSDIVSVTPTSDQAETADLGARASVPVRCSQCGWLGDATELGAEGECGGEGCPGTAVSEISTPAVMIDAWQDSEGQICGPQLAEAGLIAPHSATAEEAKQLDLQPGDSVWDLTEAGKAVLNAARGQGGSDGL